MTKKEDPILIQSSLDEYKAEVETYLLMKKVPYITDQLITKDKKFVNYSFGTVIDEEDYFGLIGYNRDTKKIIFTVIHNPLSVRNEKKEGMNDGVYVILKNLNDFCRFFSGVKINSSMLEK